MSWHLILVEINMSAHNRRRQLRSGNTEDFKMVARRPQLLLPLNTIRTAQGIIIQVSQQAQIYNPSITSTMMPLYNPNINLTMITQIAAAEMVDPRMVAMNAVLADIKLRIFDIIEAVTMKVSFDKIIKLAKDLEEFVNIKVKIVKLIQTIENTLYSIIGNITQRIEYQLILTRIDYIKELINDINTVDNTFALNYENMIVGVLMDIIQSITEKYNYDLLSKLIVDLQTSIKDQVAILTESQDIELIKIIEECEPIIISIIGNISQKVDLNIVLNRVYYLQDILKNAKI